MSGFRKLVKGVGLVLDALSAIEAVGKIWIALPTIVAILAWIAHMVGANAFEIAVWIPIASAAALFCYAIYRAMKLLGHTQIVKGVPPIMAIDLYTDPVLRAKRDTAASKQYEVWARMSVLAKQMEQAARRNRQALIGAKVPTEPPEEELNLKERSEKLAHEKTLADLEERAASHDVSIDLYAKLANGKLMAHGFLLPMKAGTPPVDIPSAEWHMLRFDKRLSIAKCQGIEYQVISIRQE